jgi:hypothetical protein
MPGLIARLRAHRQPPPITTDASLVRPADVVTAADVGGWRTLPPLATTRPAPLAPSHVDFVHTLTSRNQPVVLRSPARSRSVDAPAGRLRPIAVLRVATLDPARAATPLATSGRRRHAPRPTDASDGFADVDLAMGAAAAAPAPGHWPVVQEVAPPWLPAGNGVAASADPTGVGRTERRDGQTAVDRAAAATTSRPDPEHVDDAPHGPAPATPAVAAILAGDASGAVGPAGAAMVAPAQTAPALRSPGPQPHVAAPAPVVARRADPVGSGRPAVVPGPGDRPAPDAAPITPSEPPVAAWPVAERSAAHAAANGEVGNRSPAQGAPTHDSVVVARSRAVRVDADAPRERPLPDRGGVVPSADAPTSTRQVVGDGPRVDRAVAASTVPLSPPADAPRSMALPRHRVSPVPPVAPVHRAALVAPVSPGRPVAAQQQYVVEQEGAPEVHATATGDPGDDAPASVRASAPAGSARAAGPAAPSAVLGTLDEMPTEPAPVVVARLAAASGTPLPADPILSARPASSADQAEAVDVGPTSPVGREERESGDGVGPPHPFEPVPISTTTRSSAVQRMSTAVLGPPMRVEPATRHDAVRPRVAPTVGRGLSRPVGVDRTLATPSHREAGERLAASTARADVLHDEGAPRDLAFAGVSVHRVPAPPLAAAPPSVASTPASAASAPPAAAPPRVAASDLVDEVYDGVLRRLRHDLLLDRERRGRLGEVWADANTGWRW